MGPHISIEMYPVGNLSSVSPGHKISALDTSIQGSCTLGGPKNGEKMDERRGLAAIERPFLQRIGVLISARKLGPGGSGKGLLSKNRIGMDRGEEVNNW